MDRSNGYERVAVEFLDRRGSGRSIGVGVNAVRKWAHTLPGGAAVIDLGCGPGVPITEVLVTEGLHIFGVDAAPSFVQAFRRVLPNTPVVCEAVQDSRFFDRMFDGVLAWGLMYLLSPEDQQRLIQRIADILVPGGRLLFTSPAEPMAWNDAMTGLESRSLGAEEYRRQLSAGDGGARLVSSVPLLRSAISARWSTAPLGSVTVPVSAPVDADCAHTSSAWTTRSRQATTSVKRRTIESCRRKAIPRPAQIADAKRDVLCS
jgi:SAM-dependent methyltransferase